MIVGAWSVFWISMAVRAIFKAIVTSREKVLLSQVKQTENN